MLQVSRVHPDTVPSEAVPGWCRELPSVTSVERHPPNWEKYQSHVNPLCFGKITTTVEKISSVSEIFFTQDIQCFCSMVHIIETEILLRCFVSSEFLSFRIVTFYMVKCTFRLLLVT